jgi:FtsH-binding integral membrane protein
MADYAELSVAGRAVAETDVQTRARFIARTYGHLMGAVAAFVGLEVLYFQTGIAESVLRTMVGAPWLLVLGAFVLVSWFASKAAATAESKVAQYAALGAYVVAESLIFVPLLYIANHKAPGVIASASLVTGLGFIGLTAIAFITRKDFSFLRGLLMWGGMGALLAIVGGAIFGFQLGTWFSVGMIVFAGAAILYDTSNVLQTYPEERYVSASLQLFASVMLLLWYVMRLFLSRK